MAARGKENSAIIPGVENRLTGTANAWCFTVARKSVDNYKMRQRKTLILLCAYPVDENPMVRQSETRVYDGSRYAVSACLRAFTGVLANLT